MKNNLAELKDVSINIESLRAAWAEQLVFSGDFEWGKRNYVSLDFFTEYFQQLLLDIENVIGEKPIDFTTKEQVEKVIGEKSKNYIIQLHDGSIPLFSDTLYNDKFYLDLIHTDAYRTSCVNIPVYYDKMEPVYFYDDESVQKKIVEHNIDKRHDGLPRIDLAQAGQGFKTPLRITPNQVGQYSENHPTIMNVQNWHNVRVMDLASPRVFIQISYDIHFDEIVAKNINTRIL